MPVLGILAAPAPPYAENVSAIRRGLSEAGFVEGRNLAMEFRWAEGQLDRLPALAADLVNRQVALIVTVGGWHLWQTRGMRLRQSPSYSTWALTRSALVLSRASTDRAAISPASALCRWRSRRNGSTCCANSSPRQEPSAFSAIRLIPASRLLYRICMPRRVHSGLNSLSDTLATRATLTWHSRALFGVAFKRCWLMLIRSF